MCCSNRRQQGCYTNTRCARRTPALVTLSKKAYDKYQERKQLRDENSTSNRAPSPPPEQMESSANAEILHKAGIAPPNYDDVVRRADPVTGEKSDAVTRGSGKEEVDSLSDDEELYQVVDGQLVLNPDFAAAQAEFVRKWKAKRAAA